MSVELTTLAYLEEESDARFRAKNHTIRFDSLYDNGTKSTSWTLTASNSQYQKATLSGNAILSISPIAGASWTIYLHLTQSGAGNTLTLPTGLWEGGTVGANTEVDGALDILMIHYTGAAYVFNYMNDVK